MDAGKEKYLTFLLDNEEYGIPISEVKEIIGIMDITMIPRSPSYLKGVINLRGKIIPVIDLRIKLGLKERQYTQRTCIIVVEIPVQGTRKLTGIIVDTVSEVMGINQEEIEKASQEDGYFDEDFFSGVAKVKGKVIILLLIEKLLSSRECIPAAR